MHDTCPTGILRKNRIELKDLRNLDHTTISHQRIDTKYALLTSVAPQEENILGFLRDKRGQQVFPLNLPVESIFQAMDAGALSLHQ
jgi:hypothetical protein